MARREPGSGLTSACLLFGQTPQRERGGTKAAAERMDCLLTATVLGRRLLRSDRVVHVGDVWGGDNSGFF